MSKIIMFILLELVTATIYHADPRQTDDTPFVTASMARINPDNPVGHRWIAVSRDLEDLGFVFDTKVCVTGAGDLSGEWCVNDRMNARWVKRIDFLVNTTRKGGKWENVKISLIED
jgi:3D (Asp-Asp-Asp) domain-containing protein